jgi:hypothetical protein
MVRITESEGMPTLFPGITPYEVVVLVVVVLITFRLATTGMEVRSLSALGQNRAEAVAKIQPRANLEKIQTRQQAKIINRADHQQPADTLLAAAAKRGGNFAKI